MSIEFQWPILITLLTMYVVGFFALDKLKSFRRYFLCLVAALAMPLIVPGHGEIKAAIPCSSMFLTPYPQAWGVAGFFIVINFGIAFGVSKMLSSMVRTGE